MNLSNLQSKPVTSLKFQTFLGTEQKAEGVRWVRPAQEPARTSHHLCGHLARAAGSIWGCAGSCFSPQKANFYVTNRLDEIFQGASVSNSTNIVNSTLQRLI